MKLASIIVGVTMSAGLSLGATLPLEYREVEWIRSDGAHGLDTGVRADAGTAIEMTFNTGELPAGTATFFFGSGSGVNTYSFGHAKNDVKYVLYGSAADVLCSFTNNCEATLVITSDATDNVRMTVDKIEREECVATVALTNTTAYTTRLFCGISNKKNALFSTFALRSFRMRQGGELVRDLVPCYRTEDSAVGLYDVVSNEFLAVDAAFTKGEDAGNFIVKDIPEQLVYGTGAVATPLPVVTALDGETVLSKDNDYDVDWLANDKSGFATVKVTGKGAYSGVVNKRFHMRIGRFAKVAGTGTTGATWADAMELGAALDASVEGDVVMVQAGDYDISGNATGYSTAYGVRVRGGYKGDEGTSLALAENPVTRLDGGDITPTVFTVTNQSGVASLERFTICRAYVHAINKGGAGRLDIFSCQMLTNGCANHSVCGRGFLCETACDVTVSNCVFRGNTIGTDGLGNSSWNSGVTFFVSNVNLLMIDTDFIGNGIAPTATGGGGREIYGSAIRYNNGTLDARRCRFIGNRNGCGSKFGGTVYVVRGLTRFANCLFLGNESLASKAASCSIAAALVFNADNYSHQHSISNCTFAYNLANATDCSAAIANVGTKAGNMVSVLVRNCIFLGNMVPTTCSVGSDICNKSATGTVDVDYSFFAENTDSYLSGVLNGDAPTLVKGDHIYTGDPLFVTPFADVFAHVSTTTAEPTARPAAPIAYTADVATREGFDAHLLSPEGYKGNDGLWHKSDGAFSPAIDKGDGDWSLEPTPNGEALNLGCYGGTASASKTPEAGQPVIKEGDVTVAFENEYTQPTVRVKMSSTTPGATYAATVTITLGSYTKTFTDVVNGALVEWKVSGFLDPGTAFTVAVTADAGAGTTVATGSAEGTAQGVKPIWAGHGGGANVIHVFSGATGCGDGSSWTDAFTDFNAALQFIPADKTEVWVATNLVPTAESDGLGVPFARSIAIRGGFTGAEDSAEERTEGLVTVWNGRGVLKGVSISHAAQSVDVSIERMTFANCAGRGFALSSSAYNSSLSLTDCAFVSNGCASASGINGVGAYFYGSQSSSRDYLTDLALTNCVFADNTATNGLKRADVGCGAYISQFRAVQMVNCTFRGNGLTLEDAAETGDYTPDAVCLYLNDAILHAQGCRFVGNAMRCTGGSHGVRGLFEMRGVCGLSTFRNCLWMANEETGATTTYPGMIYLEVDPAYGHIAGYTNRVDFVNCTFAYNLSSAAASGSACLNVQKAIACVTNSIFYGNVISEGSSAGSDIQLLGADASLLADYTLFADDTTNCVNGVEGSVIDIGNHCVYGDARFMTNTREFLTLVDSAEGTKTSSRAVAPFAFDSEKCDAVRSMSVHLGGGSGYVDERDGLHKRRVGNSPAIDAGDASDFSREPRPNGRRINLGFYGNTPWATMSPGGLIFLLK